MVECIAEEGGDGAILGRLSARSRATVYIPSSCSPPEQPSLLETVPLPPPNHSLYEDVADDASWNIAESSQGERTARSRSVRSDASSTVVLTGGLPSHFYQQQDHRYGKFKVKPPSLILTQGTSVRGSSDDICEEGDPNMSRPPLKKSDPKMSLPERRRPPIYRPKSRTETPRASGTGSRVESRLRGDGGASSDDDLARLNTDLRQRLQDEASLYRRRLETYRQAQQNQAALVSKLQAKVLQYKQRCSELETQGPDPHPHLVEHHIHHDHHTRPPLPLTPTLSSSALEQAQQHLRDIREERITDLDTALSRLEEERKKCDKLMQLNSTLRDQLEESRQTNEALTSDLQKLTNDWEELREETMLKEDEWKDEEQAFNDYYSTEHNRLLNLWRDVVSIKRLYMDIQSTTEKDLSKLKSEISNMGREASMAISRVDRNTSTESLFGSTTQFKDKLYEQESADLKTQLELIRGQNDNCQTELKMKEDRIQQLLREVQNLEERCSESEQNVQQAMRMQDDMDILQGALRDIAHALIQDAETKETDLGPSTHVHLSASTPIPQKSPKRGGLRSITSPAAFAESTISAVHAALHRYQSLIHELQVKLQANREQLMLVRKQHENSEETTNVLEQRVKDLVGQLDTNKTQFSQLLQERDSLQHALEACKGENIALDRHRVEINHMVENLNRDYEKLQGINHKLQKELDVLHEERCFLQSEVDRLNQDADHREINLRAEEDRCSRMREELLTVREELNKLYLNHDMLEQQKLESDNLISALEKAKGDCERELEKVISEQSNTSDSLAKKQNVAANLEHDKKRLQDEIKRIEDEKLALQTQCSDYHNDIQSLRKELLQAEQQKLDLESDKVSLTEKTKFLEIEKNKIEIELGQVIRERGDLSNQLTVMARKKDVLNEELMRTRQKFEQCNETNSRINRNLEELVKECEEKQCTMDGMEKEMQRLQEQLAAVRCEKEALEGVLFDTQTNLEASDNKKLQLEKDQQELLVKQESLKGQITRLTKDLERAEKRCIDIKNSLTNQAGNQEAEFQQAMTHLKRQNEDNVRKLTEEREKIRINLEKRLQQTIQQLTHEKDAEIEKLLERIDTLQNHIENVCQQHEELMLRAENDKQQALLLAHHDHQALHDRLEATKRDLEAEREALERLKREANGRFEADRTTINQLKDELNKHKAKLEEFRQRCEEDKCKLEHRIGEIMNERDAAHTELENLKVQLHLSEDKVDDLHNQLHETIRKLKETENNSESLRKDLTDVRRQLSDCNIEKEKYHGTNKELREHVKRTESEKRETGRQLEEAFQKITNMEDMKANMEAEKGRLLDQLRETEKDQLSSEHKIQSLTEELQRQQSSNTQQQAEEKELQARLLNEAEERERAHQEVHQLKKQIAELERNLEQTRQELARTRAHSAHHEEEFHAREQDLLAHLEDSRMREKKLEDQKHNLEVCLVDATQQIQELKAKLSGSEGRVKALDAQLAQLEASKRDIEQKLHSVVSTLRRIAGIQLDGSVTTPYRLMSPSRRWSPARASQEHDGTADVDPEVIRKGVRNLMQGVAQVERERDDMKTQITTMRKQLQEAQDVQNKGDNKVTKLMSNLRSLQDEKGSLEAKLGQKTKALQAHNEALQKKGEETQQMRDKIVSLELTISSNNDEKIQLEDKIEKLKNSLARLESDKRNLQEELNRTENRSTKLELQRMSAEGDLQRLQMMLQEKDAHIQKIQEKCDMQSRTVSSLEERCVSLKSTIDQMNISLERASHGEAELKAEMQNLHRSLMDANQNSHSGAEKLKHLQKSLANCENERRVLAERMDASQQNVAELRRNNQIYQDQVARLNNDLANNEVQKSALESQLRMAQWPAESPTGQGDEELLRQLQSSQRERSELRGKVDSLTNKMRQMETEKRNLERNIAKSQTAVNRSKSYERPEKYELETSSSTERIDTSRVEQENRELKMKIARLEMELNERESELARIKTQRPIPSTLDSKFDRAEIERYRAAQLQAERLLEAREQSHRQQVTRLENQVTMLRDQLNQEIKRRQQYVLRSTRAGREMNQLRQALGDSLRTVSQDPSLDALLLEHEARKLDTTLSTTASLPPGLSTSYDRRSTTPQPHK